LPKPIPRCILQLVSHIKRATVYIALLVGYSHNMPPNHIISYQHKTITNLFLDSLLWQDKHYDV
jgi:hypothetical protein